MTIENANRLAELRRTHGLSQEELAERLSVSRQAVSKWERAESSPDTDNLIAVAQLYGVTLDVLLGLQLPPAIPEKPLPGEAEYEASTEEEDEPSAEPSADPSAEPSAEPLEDVIAGDPLPEGSYYEHAAREAARAAEEAAAAVKPAARDAARAAEEAAAAVANERERRRRHFPYPVMVTFAYLVLGFVFHQWHPGWIIFLTIPLFYLPESERQPLRLLGNPVMITIIYLLLGTMCNLWHPGWLIFLLIPLLNSVSRR